MKKLLAIAIFLISIPAMCSAVEYKTVAELSREAQTSDFTHDIDVGEFRSLSVQAVYSSPTISAATVSDGGISSATLTVADYEDLDLRVSSATLVLESGKNTSAIDGAVITINGRTYTEGVDWDRLVTSTMTMADLASSLDAHWEYSATASSNVIALIAYTSGTFANSWTLTSSTPAAISTVTWAFGQNAGYFTINGVTLTEGTDFDAETSSQVTANSIEEAINDNASLASIITATNSASGQVYMTANSAGVNAYPISVSDSGDISVDFYRFTGGSVSDINVSADTIAETNHGFGIGLPILFANVSGTDPGGLSDQTTYYAIPTETANAFKVSDTSTGAAAGIDIDITDVTGGGSFTFTALDFDTGSAGFLWKGSNDGTNFSDLSVSSITYSAPGNQIWDMGDYNYRYLRIDFTGPDAGGIDLDIILNGKR